MSLVGKLNINYKHRFVFFALIFIFFTFVTALLGQISMWNALPQYTFIPRWLFYPLIFSFSIAFIDVIVIFVMLLFFEAFCILAVGYVGSFTGLYRFSLTDFGNNIFTAFLSAILLIVDALWYLDLFDPIYALLTGTYWTSPADKARKKYEKKARRNENRNQQKQTEPENEAGEQELKVMHTKEELARLLNLWQQKYAQGTTDEDKKEANEMILKYTAELEKLKAKSGTTPERAKLTQGGDNE